MLLNRPLGFWETFKAITHDYCHGFETLFAITEFSGSMDIPLFIKALRYTYNRHPLLQATIQQDNDSYYYQIKESFDSIPIHFTQGISDDLVQKSASEAANCALEPQKYLWKVQVYYEKQRVIFTLVIHHAPCDGYSMMNIVDDILYAYSCYQNGDIPDRPNLPLLPPTEQLAKKNVSIEEYLQHRNAILALTTPKDSIISLGPQQQYVSIAERSTHIIYKHLDQTQTAKLLAVCNHNKFTSNSLLNGLMLTTAQHLYQDELSLAMLTPVHLKSPAHQAQVGCNVSIVTTLYEQITANTNLIELTHEFQKKLKKAYPKQAYLPKEFSTTDVCNAFGLNLNLDRYNYQLVVTNLGDIQVKKHYPGITVDNINVGVNNRVGAVACVLGTHIFDNQLHCAFIFTKPLISDDYMQQFTDHFMQQLKWFLLPKGKGTIY